MKVTCILNNNVIKFFPNPTIEILNKLSKKCIQLENRL